MAVNTCNGLKVPIVDRRLILAVDDVLDCIGFGTFQVVAFLLVGAMYVSFGFETLLFSFVSIPVQDQWGLTALEYAALPSATAVANVAGGFLFGYLSDRFGRVWPCVAALAVTGVAGLASAFSPSFPVLVAIRCVVSTGVMGVAIMGYPILTEFLPVKNRGKTLVLIIMVQAIGSCVSGGFAWWLIPSYTINGWRYFTMVTSIPSLLVTAFRLIFRYQSPRFLISAGRTGEAVQVFHAMARINGVDIHEILPENVIFDCDMKCNRSMSSKFLALFSRKYFRRTIGFALIYTLATVGYYVTVVFLPDQLKNLGTDPYFTAFVGYLGQIPGIALMSIITEWPWFRRLNSLRAFSVMCVVFFVLFAVVHNEVSIPVLTILILFGVTPLIPLLYTYISESYATEVRSMSIALFNNLSALAGIAVPYVCGYIIDLDVPWLFPTVIAGLYVVLLLATVIMNHDTHQSILHDNV